MRDGLRVFFSGGTEQFDPTTLVRVMNAAREALEGMDVPPPLLAGRIPPEGYVWRRVEGVDREFSLDEVLESIEPFEHCSDPEEEGVPTPWELFGDWSGAGEALWDPYSSARYGEFGGFHVVDYGGRRYALWAQVPEDAGRILPE